MATFTINQDITTTPSATDPGNLIEVTIDPTKPLPLGSHRFQLIVVDQAGNKSTAAVVDVRIIDTVAPTAILGTANADNVVVKPVFSSGQSFKLDGRQSIDAGGGSIVQYVWTYLGQTPA
jgi:hypothetical protein